MSVITPGDASANFDPTLDFVGLFADQTEDVILARWIDWANEGLDPVADADQWEDTREGGHWRTTLMPAIREIARLYDVAGTEVPMSGMVLWAWEIYLDDLAAAWNIFRNPATPASGVETFTGTPGTDIPAGTTVAVAPSSPTDDPPTFQTLQEGTVAAGGTIDLPIQASLPGIGGNVAASAITAQGGPIPPGVTFTNGAPTIGGEDPETDESLRARLLQALLGSGPGNVQDYIRWAGAWPGVGRVSVVPVWNGAGTVLVMVSDVNGQPLPTALISALQSDLDPVAGRGAGTAPVGAAVTVDTSSLLNVTVDATITFQAGYSWDGSGNTVAVGAGIQAAIISYLLTVPPGGTIRNAHVAGIIATWTGVDNVSTVQLNAGVAGADLAVGLTPPQVPVLVAFNVH